MTSAERVPPRYGGDGRGSLAGVIDLVAVPRSVARAREYVRERLGDAHPVVGDVTLLVSEVVTNAIVHSDSGDGGWVTLVVVDCGDLVHVNVVDAGGAAVPQVRGDMSGEGGRGLLLVEMITSRWGVQENDAGRAVWFQVRYRTDDGVEGLFCPRPREAM
ncbi:ATP-binding protein [Sphaerisporangium aureirubrum]|uniref:ATP-binding protein n=1 Tax=Sphaerisporangium aureirubrum TaxID=1544736 RepID=A0ABW1NDN1_9ACTN